MRRRVLVAAGLLLAACGTARDAPPGAGELIAAAEAGDVERLRALLADGVDVDGRDFRGRTAVTAAALADEVEAARTLIAAGANVDLQDAERNNPLLVTGQTGSVAMLQAVLAADPDLKATNRYGGTALIPAAERGHVDLVRALLGTAIDVDHVNRLGWTALLEAVILSDGGPVHQEIVRLLLDAGASRHRTDNDGVTPLEHARRRGYAELAALLG